MRLFFLIKVSDIIQINVIRNIREIIVSYLFPKIRREIYTKNYVIKKTEK